MSVITVPCKIPYNTDATIRAATKGVTVTQIDALATKKPIGPAQLITIDKIDQANPISLTGAGTVFVQVDVLDLTGAVAAVPFTAAVNVGLPPVTGFSLVLPAQWS
jgi:hypothetical protein